MFCPSLGANELWPPRLDLLRGGVEFGSCTMGTESIEAMKKRAEWQLAFSVCDLEE